MEKLSFASARLGAGLVKSWLVATALLSGCQAPEQTSEARASRPLHTEDPPGPIAYWQFEEGGGDTSTDVHGIVGALFNGAAFTANGRKGRALKFDGVDSMFEVDAPPGVNDVMTVAAWVRQVPPLAPGTLGTVLGRASGYELAISDEGQVWVFTQAGSPPVTRVTLTPPIWWIPPDGRYHHVAFTKTPSQLRIHVDGFVVATNATVAGPISDSGVLTIGASPMWSGQHFRGDIDEVRIYNRALSPAEVGNLASWLSITPSRADFGGVLPGQMSAVELFTVTNEGDAPSGALSMFLSGADQSHFLISTNGCASSLAPGATCTVGVRFRPTSGGEKRARLTASTFEAGTNEAELLGEGLAPSLAITPGAHDFGEVATGVTSPQFTFTVTNTGQASSGTLTLEVTGANLTEFGITTPTCTTLAPAESCVVPVSFSPTSVGPKAATLRVSGMGTVAFAFLAGQGRLPPLPLGEPCLENRDCTSDICVDGVCCGDSCGGGVPGDCQACSVAAGASADGTCAPVLAGRTCRGVAGPCDLAESCDGVSAACPPDSKQPADTACRAAGGACDLAEVCDGTSANCPPDLKQTGTICRTSGGLCDPAESCDAVSNDCPPDQRLTAGTICQPSAGPCDAVETCDGVAATCPPDLKRPLGSICAQTLGGPCDVMDRCTGDSNQCPEQYAGDGTVCFAGSLPCQGLGVCSGSAAACPLPEVAPTCDATAFETSFRGQRHLRIKPASGVQQAADDVATFEEEDGGTACFRPTAGAPCSPSPYSQPFSAEVFAPGDVDAAVSSRIEGSAELGSLKAIVTAAASAPSFSGYDPAETYGEGIAALKWKDRITITSDTLPAETEVQLLAQVELHSTFDNDDGQVVGSEPARATASVSVVREAGDCARGNAEDKICGAAGASNNVAKSADLVRGEALVWVRVGDTLSIEAHLETRAIARLTGDSVSVTTDAGHTAKVRLVPLTPGVAYTTASGRGPYLPDAAAPAVLLQAPPEGTPVRGTILVTTSATDDLTGVARIDLHANGAPAGSCARGGPCQLAVNTAAFPDGPLELTAVAHDFEGNASAPARRLVIVDNAAPVLAVPATIDVFATSAGGAVVEYQVNAMDGQDGALVFGCTPASGGLFPPGITTVVCTATDAAGNTSTASFPVSVTFSWSGVLAPVDADGGSVFKLGSTVPVKFRLTGASAPIADLAAFLLLGKLPSTGTELEAVSTAAADSGNRFRQNADQYIFNLATRGLSVGTWRLRIDLGDGVPRQVEISLR